MSTPALTGLSHITLAVSALPRSVAFYTALGLRLRMRSPRSAYLEAGDLWLCLVEGPVTARTDYTHVALRMAPDAMERFAHLRRWQENTSPGASLYILDPDGHRLELHDGTLADRLAALRGQPGVRVFD